MLSISIQLIIEIINSFEEQTNVTNKELNTNIYECYTHTAYHSISSEQSDNEMLPF